MYEENIKAHWYKFVHRISELSGRWAKFLSIPTFQIQMLNRCYCRKKSYRFYSHSQNQIRIPYQIRILMFSGSQSCRDVISILFLRKISLVACVVWNSFLSPTNLSQRNAPSIIIVIKRFFFFFILNEYNTIDNKRQDNLQSKRAVKLLHISSSF